MAEKDEERDNAEWGKAPAYAALGATALLVWNGVRPRTLAAEFVLVNCQEITLAAYGKAYSELDMIESHYENLGPQPDDETHEGRRARFINTLSDRAGKVNLREKDDRAYTYCPEIHKIFDRVSDLVEEDNRRTKGRFLKLKASDFKKPMLYKVDDEWSTRRKGEGAKKPKKPKNGEGEALILYKNETEAVVLSRIPLGFVLKTDQGLITNAEAKHLALSILKALME